VPYNLIVDNKRIADETAKLSIDEFYQTTPLGKLQQSDALQRHPERIPGITKITPTLESVNTGVSASIPTNAGDGPPAAPSPNSSSTGPKSPHVKRAKWHLGIRSQSRPEDIMYEVFRAMKTLDFEWKVLNAYHVIVRRKPESSNLEPPKMSLQLYQVDQRSYLLDFKSLVDEESNSANSSRHASVSMPVKPSLRANRAQSLPMPMEVEQTPPPSPTPSKQSQTMQFFEMCASLIGTLAR